MTTETTKRILECPVCGRVAIDVTPEPPKESASDFYRRTQSTRITTPVEEV